MHASMREFMIEFKNVLLCSNIDAEYQTKAKRNGKKQRSVNRLSIHCDGAALNIDVEGKKTPESSLNLPFQIGKQRCQYIQLNAVRTRAQPLRSRTLR